MFDHLTINVADYRVSRAFYEKALAPLGMKVLYEEGDVACGFGADRPRFWLSMADAEHPASSHVHIAFSGASHDEVKSFYNAAIAAGGRDNGVPGPRPDYGDEYFAGFVYDLDGNNIEAVFRG